MDDEKLTEAAQGISAALRRARSGLPTAEHATLRLTEVLRALNEDPGALYLLARAHGRKFPGDRGYCWYHLKRWVRDAVRWLW